MPAATPSAQEAARTDDVAAEAGGGKGGEGDCDATFVTAEGHPRAASFGRYLIPHSIYCSRLDASLHTYIHTYIQGYII